MGDKHKTSNSEFKMRLETITSEMTEDLDLNDDDSSSDESSSSLTYTENNNSVVEELSFTTSSSIESGGDHDGDSEDGSSLEENKHETEFIDVDAGLLIILAGNSHVYFHGFMSIKILHGTVECLGYTLTSSSPSQNLYSPRGSSFLFIKNANCKEDINKKLIKESLSSTDDVVKILKKVKSTSAVIFCKKIDSFKINFMVRHIAQQIFPNTEFPCKFGVDDTSTDLIKIHPELDSIISNINKNSKILLSGGKGVGKSTTLRYTVNKLLMKYPEVLVFDLDPGQPEFTVPGCISASIVTDPVFGPNYTHLREPNRCVFVSNVDISAQPQDYIHKVKLLKLLCEDLPPMPTVINYMGYTRGFGLNIFSSVVVCVKPSSIIEIRSSNPKKNFYQPLSHNLIMNSAKTLTPNTKLVPNYVIIPLAAMTDQKKEWTLEPRKIREMCVLSYFGALLSDQQKYITDVTTHTYQVEFSSVNIIDNEQMGVPEPINGNLVVLCKFVLEHDAYLCYGWGIVRGVYYVKELLYITTPVDTNSLELVDSLVLGSVSLPPSMYMECETVNSRFIPYISKEILPSLGKIPKRSHLPRDIIKSRT